MNIPPDTLKTLLAALAGKPPADAGETGAADLAAILVPGREIVAELLERRPNGRYLVRAAGELFDMQLPAEARPGTSIKLIYVGDTPRLTFALRPPADKGSDVSLSSAGKWLGALATGSPPEAKGVPLRFAGPPLISGELPLDRPMLTARLREAVARSGLFYESHLARWRDGAFPLDELMQEPQARESAILTEDPAEKAPPADEREAAAAQSRQPAGGTGKLSAPLLPEAAYRRDTVPPSAGDRSIVNKGSTGSSTAPLPSHPGAGATAEPTGAPPPPRNDSPAYPPTNAQPAPDGPRSPLPGRQETAPPSPPAPPESADTPLPDRDGVTQRTNAQPDTDGAAGRRGDAHGAPLRETPPTQPGETARPLPITTPLPPGDMKSDEARAENRLRTPFAPGETAPRESLADAETAGNRQSPLPPRHDMKAPRTFPAPYDAPLTPPVIDGPPREALVITPDKPLPAPFEPPSPQTVPIIRQQLEFLQSGQFVWQGEAWNGQRLEWRIGREDKRKGDESQQSWETGLNLELPNLGRISARLHLSGGDVRVSLVATRQASVEIMEQERERLVNGMEAAGLRLTGIEVRHEPSP